MRTYWRVCNSATGENFVAFCDYGEDEPNTLFIDPDIPPIKDVNTVRRIVSALNEQTRNLSGLNSHR